MTGQNLFRLRMRKQEESSKCGTGEPTLPSISLDSHYRLSTTMTHQRVLHSLPTKKF